MGRFKGFFNYLSRFSYFNPFNFFSAGIFADRDEPYDGERANAEREAVLEEIASLAVDDSRNLRDLFDDERKPAKRVILIDDAFVEDVLSNFIQIP